MRQANRRQILRMGTAATALAMLGADKPKSSLFGKKEPPLKQDETVGDLAYIPVTGAIRVEGVGLVVGLEGTGSDPEPSVYRQKLLGLMRAAQVPKAEQILASKETSLVIVRASIPPGCTRADRFDATLELTPASGTTSLAGGLLLEAELAFVGVVDGQAHEGKVLAKVHGPVLTGSADDPENLRVGRVLGGARTREDFPHTLMLRENRKGVRGVALLQKAIGTRFFYLDGPNQKSMAQATVSDDHLTLRVPQIYHQNQDRYFKVLQRLNVIDTPELRAQRLERWGKELLDPKTAGDAALRLEGIGPNAATILQTGLASADPMVRYFAAEALAYLNDDSGAEVLAQAILTRPEFRAFALAAMAATDQPGSLMKLRELMAHPETEVRYGAFNALRSADPNDFALGRVEVLRFEPPPPPEDGNAMAYQIAVARQLAQRREDPFDLYLVDCDGPPMIHVSNTRRAEIVIFGHRQRLLTPVVLGGPGSLLLNAGLEDNQVQIARVSGGSLDRPDQTVSSRLDLGEVVREMANLGATYPEIVAVLRGAERQKNLEGPLVIDAVPSANPDYDRAQLAGVKPGGEARKDEGVSKAAAETPRPRRGFFQRFRRDR